RPMPCRCCGGTASSCIARRLRAGPCRPAISRAPIWWRSGSTSSGLNRSRGRGDNRPRLLAPPSKVAAGGKTGPACAPTRRREKVLGARRIIDISVPLQSDIASDPPGLEPRITYIDHKESAPAVCAVFPGLAPGDLPDGEGWAIERVEISTHNGTHLDAP